jgi:hypothetical protein
MKQKKHSRNKKNILSFIDECGSEMAMLLDCNPWQDPDGGWTRAEEFWRNHREEIIETAARMGKDMRGWMGEK